tara:strand:+ start:3375 stop:3662 length:288 start_codon:yes stop_codon:yes gene_type:complete
MAIEILTKNDLNEFGKLLLDGIRSILKGKNENLKKGLKSTEVRKLLNIFPGTLQNLRINGTLPYTKGGGILYYDNAAIDKLLIGNKIHAQPTLFT